MKLKSISILFLLMAVQPASFTQPALNDLSVSNISAVSFDEYFRPVTLRIDYVLAGDEKNETVYYIGMKEEPYWGGPRKNLIDPFGYGTYRYSVFDSASGKLIFQRGFCSLFQEWKGTPEAKTVRKAFSMVAIMPFPKNTIHFVIEKRSYETNKFVSLFDRYISPSDYFIHRDNPSSVKVTKLKASGDPSHNVDIAFIAEGYTAHEMDKFREDARIMYEYFMTVEPFKSLSNHFNFYAIESPSAESGVTIPGKDIYVNTNIHSTFYTFDMDRYLTTSDTKSIYDIASAVPFDVPFVLVNSKRYGGGGFYNHYGQSTVDHQLSKIVAIHEFGHAFAGLADEYYDAEITYSDFYNLRFEPWEPNITTNVEFDRKWKSMIPKGTPLPTPRTEQYKSTLGMFEGGGYVGKGIYSPMMDCRMKSNDAPGFCPACTEAIRRMIIFYCD